MGEIKKRWQRFLNDCLRGISSEGEEWLEPRHRIKSGDRILALPCIAFFFA